MKSQIKYLYAMATMLLLNLSAVPTAIAQETSGGSTTSSTTTTSATSNGVDASWLQDNWMWIAGAVILLIILIVAMSSRKTATTTIERTTVIKDNSAV